MSSNSECAIFLLPVVPEPFQIQSIKIILISKLNRLRALYYFKLLDLF